MSRPLYEIDEQLNRLISLDDNSEYSCFDPDTGELIDSSALEELKMERNTKIENIALFIKNDKAEQEMIEQEQRRLSSRLKALRNHQEWLKQYLMNSLHYMQFKTPFVSISYRNSTSVVCEDPTLLPVEYQKVTVEARKQDIANALKAGVAVQGATLENKCSIIIR